MLLVIAASSFHLGFPHPWRGCVALRGKGEGTGCCGLQGTWARAAHGAPSGTFPSTGEMCQGWRGPGKRTGRWWVPWGWPSFSPRGGFCLLSLGVVGACPASPLLGREVSARQQAGSSDSERNQLGVPAGSPEGGHGGIASTRADPRTPGVSSHTEPGFRTPGVAPMLRQTPGPQGAPSTGAFPSPGACSCLGRCWAVCLQRNPSGCR